MACTKLFFILQINNSELRESKTCFKVIQLIRERAGPKLDFLLSPGSTVYYAVCAPEPLLGWERDHTFKHEKLINK